MYFEPLTTWMVVLIADGIIVSGEQLTDSKMYQYYKRNATEGNAFLNNEIRRRLGTQAYLADSEVKFIHRLLNNFKSRVEYRYFPLELDPDVQTLIINLYVECITSHTKTLHQYENSYKNSKSAEHKTRLEQYICEEKRIISFCQQILTSIEEQRKKKAETDKKRAEESKKATTGFAFLLILLTVVFLIVLCIVSGQ